MGQVTLFLAEFPLAFWLKVDYNLLPLFLAFSPRLLYSFTNIVYMLDCYSFAACIETHIVSLYVPCFHKAIERCAYFHCEGRFVIRFPVRNCWALSLGCIHFVV